MNKFDFKKSSLLKLTCYILIPIIATVLILSIVYGIFISENKDFVVKASYFETEEFSDRYYSEIFSSVQKVKEEKYYNEIEAEETIEIEDYIGQVVTDTTDEISEDTATEGITYSIDEDVDLYYNYQSIYTELQNNGEIIRYETNGDRTNFNYLILDSETGIAYTNLECTSKTDTTQKIKTIILDTNYYWGNENNDINTSIDDLSIENINYLDRVTITSEIPNSNIYTSINNELDKGDSFFRDNTTFNMIKDLNIITTDLNLLVCSLISMVVFLLVIAVYLLFAIGHKKGYDGIYLNWYDKLPLEVVGVITIFVVGMVVAIISDIYFSNIFITIAFVYIMFYIIYIAFATAGVTFIKRIKAKTLIKDTLTYKVFKYIMNIFKKIYNSLFNNLELTLKLGIFYGLFITGSIILCLTGVGIILALVLWVYIFINILKDVNNYKEVKNALEEVYMGKTDVKLEEDKYKGELKDIAIYVNDISDGFENAVEESLKSERLKTELITNVSHDIKTPLTSIINYVDLLKKEDIDSEKAKEYLEILDNKSQRLKKLTEDLVEASKVSSGNVKLNIEKINVVELIKQTNGEFEEKFNEKGLQVITEIPDKDVFINADSKYMYRIVENLFSNVSKYALDNSRVYINMEVKNKIVKIAIKNISKERLNITTDELMQRFVRGDKSRVTEGSGLGLSISKSLTEIQKGKFDMQIDGDLFKVELEFSEI